MQDVSGVGLILNVVASATFPAGFPVTQFADDTDPLDMPEIATADKAMGLNGDLVVWSKATPLEVAVAVIPGSEDDQNLSILLEANRVGAGKRSARDVVALTAIYPSGRTLTVTPGRIMAGMIAPSIASSGRMKTRVYKFVFENRTGEP